MDFREVAVVLLVGGLLLVGCGEDDKTQVGGDTAKTETASAPADGGKKPYDPRTAPKTPFDPSQFATPSSPGMGGGAGAGFPGMAPSIGMIPNPRDPDNPVEYREATDAEIEQLVAGLGDPIDPASHSPGGLAAAKELMTIGPKAGPQILKGLDDPNPVLRQAAMFTLANMFYTEAVPKIAEILDNEDEVHDVRITAAKALGVIRSPLAVEALLRHVNAKESHVRFFVLNSLGQQEDPKAIPALAETAVGAEDAVMRRSAIYSLGIIKDPLAIPHLGKLLDDQNNDIRMQAARAMGEIGGQATVPFLSRALKDTSADVRREALYSLNSVGGDEVVAAIIELLEREKKDFVVHMALWSIGQIGSESHVEIAKRFAAGPNWKLRERALRTMYVLNGSPSYGEIRNELQSEDPALRLYAIWLLTNEGTGDAMNIPDVAPLVSDENPIVRRAAVGVLGVFRSRKVIPIFRKVLETEKDLKILRAALVYAQVYTGRKTVYSAGTLGTRSLQEMRMHYVASDDDLVQLYIDFLMHEDVRLREGAQTAIAECSGMEFSYSFSADEEERRVAQAEIQAWWKEKSELGPRGWLQKAIEEGFAKLESSDPIEREIYSDALRSVTGQPYRVSLESSDAEVKKALAKWSEWWAANRDKSRLEWLVGAISDETRPLTERRGIFTEIYWFYTGEHFGVGPTSTDENMRGGIKQFLEYWGENSERLLEEHASR